MPIDFLDVAQRRVGTGGAITFKEDEFPSTFPFALWNAQQNRYLEYWNMFMGTWLQEETQESDEHGNPVLRYPLQINFLKKTCMEHSYILFGEVNDIPGPLAPIRITPRIKPGQKKPDDETRRRAEELEDFINRVWTDNNGRSLQQEAGLMCQFLGGIVFRLGWQPEDEDLEFGIRLEHMSPELIYPVWDGGHPDNLLEMWVAYRMPTREAHWRFNYPLENGGSDPMYVEHWTKDKINIWLAGEYLDYEIAGEHFHFEDMPNPFKFVPFIYIPRERAGSFFGLSLLDDAKELAKEMNARLADISDVIGETSHRDVYMRNVNISPKTTDIGGSRPAINLGQTPPGGEMPDVFAIDPPPINEAMVSHVELLRDIYGRDVSVPSVAEGEDEGSQRSALTLAFRMHPLTAKVRAVRTYWTTGLILLAKRVAKMAIAKKVGGITAKHLDNVDWAVDWSPMIPRDREADLNEVVLGIQTNMITPRTGNKMLGMTEDPGNEEDEVKEWLTFIQSLTAQQTDSTTQDSIKGKVQTQTKVQPIATIMKEPGES
jgi:hypothetical protein